MAKVRLVGAPDSFAGYCYRYSQNCQVVVNPQPSDASVYRGSLEEGITGWNGSFYVDHVDTSGALVSGVWRDQWDYKNVFVNRLGFNAASYSPTIGSIPLGSYEYYASKLAAMVNPNRSKVDIPVALFELRELPDLIKDAGFELIDIVADLTLRGHFGIQPMINDFKALLDFQGSVEKRIREINSYASPNRTRKRALDGGAIETNLGTRTLFSSPSWGAMNFSGKSITTYKVWGYCNVSVPNSFAALLSDGAKVRNLARRAIGGLYLDPYRIWQAMPWSWLVDWFVNVGDFLEANAGAIPTSVDGIRICVQTDTTEHWSCMPNNVGVPIGFPITTRRVTKRRKPVYVLLPGARPPLLTGGQIGILSAIGVTRKSPSYVR